MAELEATFGCPVIESYGMTEAAHQMASNPLPPGAAQAGQRRRRRRSGGRDHGDGRAAARAGEIGEIVIRGPNVTAGYENNPTANAEAFAHGWFRTGDQGTMDDEGYLRVTGRLKEIINRGGEKISPREVDEVLMDHPAVAQVVTFAMPHDKLGEEVAAAIVLREGRRRASARSATSAADRLADFKVPRKVRDPRRDPEGRDRQAAADRPGGEARASADEDRHLRRRRDRRPTSPRSSRPQGEVELSLVARGAHLAAIRADGLTLIEGEQRQHAVRSRASDDAGRRSACRTTSSSR